jgi:hypothetical protein
VGGRQIRATARSLRFLSWQVHVGRRIAYPGKS